MPVTLQEEPSHDSFQIPVWAHNSGMLPTPARFVNVEPARARFGDRVDRLAPYLSRLDPLADAVVEMIESSPAQGWRMFSQAAAVGIAHVKDAPASLRELFGPVEDPPLWVDWAVLDRGGDVLLRAGPIGGLVLAVRSLVLGYASPAGNKPLILSGRLQDNAVRRLNETARFVQATCRQGGLRRFADGYQITLKVRLIHAQVRRMIVKSGRWREDLWGAPINQHDLVGTSLLFSAVLLDGLRKLGVRVSAEDGEAYMQLWRYSAHLIGVDPALVPCSELEAKRLAELIAATQAPPDEDSRKLTHALLSAGTTIAKTRAEKRNAERHRMFGAALCRELLGGELADQLGVEKTTWRLMLPFMRRFVSGMEFLRASVPLADVPALWAGSRYWDRVVEIGLSGATAEFGLPERLAAARVLSGGDATPPGSKRARL